MNNQYTIIHAPIGADEIYIRANLSEASAPVEISTDGEEWNPTQYQAADACHTTAGLIDIGERLARRKMLVDEDYLIDFKEIE